MTDTNDLENRGRLETEIERQRRLTDDLRNEPLAFWDLNKVSEIACICCAKDMSHISAYPFHASPQFARQIILWCDNCGFGMVPETSFSLEDYYRSTYATQNRRDRNLDPEQYFAKMDSGDPPKNLARYIGRARNQLKFMRKYRPEIGSMLDVGAGPGYALRASGAQAKFALEFDRHSRKFLDHIGAEVVDWESVSDHRYDVVLLSHSLEHFQYSDVITRLSMLFDCLNPGGLLYVEVPPGGLGWKYYDYKHEPHTLFFTPEALQGIAEQLDGEILLCGPGLRTYHLISDLEQPIYSGGKGRRLGNPRGRLTLILQKTG